MVRARISEEEKKANKKKYNKDYNAKKKAEREAGKGKAEDAKPVKVSTHSRTQFTEAIEALKTERTRLIAKLAEMNTALNILLEIERGN